MDWKCVATGAALAGSLAGSAAGAGLKAEIVRTAYGIPHVTAQDFAGLGYGAAYAYAQDNLCLLANELVTASAERSRFFGADATIELPFAPVSNLAADTFFKSAVDLPALRRGLANTSADYRGLIRGWAAGYNRYLHDTPPAKRPAACANAAWVRPMTEDDVLRMAEYRARVMSGVFMLNWIVSAAPPAAPSSSEPPPKPLAQADLQAAADAVGSNGWAFGRDVTANGSGLLVGNPHVPWSGGIRFYEIHLSVPGKLDVMGIMNAGAPVVTMGFNHDVAWTHTVDNARHFTVFELTLDPTDPTAYIVDGKRLAMERRTVSIDAAGKPPVARTLYRTIYGPLIVTPVTPWTSAHAYAFADADRGNQRQDDTWLAMARARSVGDLHAAIARTTGLAWVNTIAADRHGDALYADISAVPNVSAEKLKTCATATPRPPQFAQSGFFGLDGARSTCAWDKAPGAAAPGLMPGAAMPSIVRTDFVQNANDSFWLTNPKAAFAPQSPLLGRVGVTQGPRTRAGLAAIAGRLDGSDGLGGRQIDPDKAKAMLFANRNARADLVLDDVLAACPARPDLAAACAVLAKWDRRNNLDSVGAVLFAEFWRRVATLPDPWRVPFDAADPVGTPRGLAMDGDKGAKVLQALAAAAEQMHARNLALDVRVRDAQFTRDGTAHVPVHGGEGLDGVLNAIESRFDPAAGGYVAYSGSSFIQIVTFDAHGPVADAVLTHSQSSDPASPHFADQTRLFSRKAWVRLPFSRADVAAQAEGPPLRISE